MAFDNDRMSPINTANSTGGRFWMYKADVNIAGSVGTANYFDDAVSMGLLDEDTMFVIGTDLFGIYKAIVHATTKVVTFETYNVVSS